MMMKVDCILYKKLHKIIEIFLIEIFLDDDEDADNDDDGSLFLH